MTKIEVIKSKGQWFSRIVAGNGETLWHSEKYTRKASAYKTLASFFKNINGSLQILENGIINKDGYLTEIIFHLSNKK